MKAKMKCAQCATRFEPKRSDAKYCSNACKQKSFYQKEKKTNTSNLPETFHLSDYQSYINYIGFQENDFSLIFYCFLRRNLVEDSDLITVVNYINSIWIEPYDLEKNRLIRSGAYKKFEERFLNAEFRII